MTFAERLRYLMDAGNLTGADLARWYGRSDPTVRGWISGNHELGGPPLDAAFVEAQTVKLEKLLKKGQGLPVPRMSPKDRIRHLNKLKTA